MDKIPAITASNLIGDITQTDRNNLKNIAAEFDNLVSLFKFSADTNNDYIVSTEEADKFVKAIEDGNQKVANQLKTICESTISIPDPDSKIEGIGELMYALGNIGSFNVSNNVKSYAEEVTKPVLEKYLGFSIR